MNRRTIGQVAFAILLIALATWNFLKPSDGRKIDLNPYKALGSVASGETSKLLGHQGGIVIVIPDPGTEADPVMDAQIAAYRSGLKEAGKVSIQAVETVKMDSFLRMQTGGAMPAEQFLALLKRHPSAGAFVLFIGFPGLMDSEIAQVQSHRGKRIVISASLPNYQELIETGALHMAIVPRTNSADERLPTPTSTREAFDQEYLILRPAAAAP